MEDYMIRATALDGQVRTIAANTTNTINELQRRHQTWPTATAALGRTATAGVMMGSLLKGDAKLTIQVKGNGPLGQIVVDANTDGEVRGYVDNPQVDLPLNKRSKLDVAGAVGTEGFVYVIKDLGLKEPYRGSSPIVSGELAEDFTHYFAVSEQTPSAVALGVLVNPDGTVKAAGGLIIQVLPGLSEDEIREIENRLAQLASVTTLLEEGQTLDAILESIVGPIQILSRTEVRFHCQCSAERASQTLISLGKDELRQILEEDGKAEMICHFCNEAYTYNDEKLRELLAQATR